MILYILDRRSELWVLVAKVSKIQNLSLESQIQHKHQQTNRSCSSILRFSLTFIEGLRLFLDMATIPGIQHKWYNLPTTLTGPRVMIP